MQLDKIFSTQFLDATTGLPLSSLTGVTITILEINELDGTTSSIPVNAQACINGGNGFYRYYYSGMGDTLYEYFINPNNTNTVISSGWVDKRLNRLDKNVSDIVLTGSTGGGGGGGKIVSMIKDIDKNALKDLTKKAEEIYSKVYEIGKDTKAIRESMPKSEMNAMKELLDNSQGLILDSISKIGKDDNKSDMIDAMKAISEGFAGMSQELANINSGVKNISENGLIASIAGIETTLTQYSKSLDHLNARLLVINTFPDRIREVTGTVINVHADINKNINEIKGSTNLFLSADVQLNMRLIQNSISELGQKISDVKRDIAEKKFSLVVEE